jgi:flavorubredoxin
MWGSTERMIMSLTDVLSNEAVEVSLHNLAVADLGDIAKDLVDSKAIVLSAPPVLGGVHPLAVYAAYLVKALRPPIKFGAILSSYGWGGGAVKHVQTLLDSLKIEVAGALEINGPPTENDIKRIEELGKTIAEKNQ